MIDLERLLKKAWNKSYGTPDEDAEEDDYDDVGHIRRVCEIITFLDESRIDQVGGYPSEYEFCVMDDHIYVAWASLDAGKDFNAATLTFCTIEEFGNIHEKTLAYIYEQLGRDYKWWIDD